MNIPTTSELLTAAAATAPDTVALISGDTWLTFGDWHRRSRAVAAGLRVAGVPPGSAVWLDLPGRHPLLPVAYVGVLRAGAVAVLGGSLPAAELERAACRTAPVLAAVITDRDLTPPVPALRLDDLLGTVAPDTEAAVAPGDDADVCFTSGTTTGGRRGVVNSHALLHALAVVDTPVPTADGSGGVWHPFGFDTSQGRILMLMAIASRRTTVAGRGGGRATVAEFDAYRPATVYTSPYVLRAVGAATTGAFPFVQRVSMVTDAATGPDLDLARRLFPAAAIGTEYGSSEAGVACTKLVYGTGPASSVGRAGSGTELRVDTAGDAAGPVLLRFRGTPTPRYWDDPEATAATFLPDGWVRTGDLGYLDADGFLHLAGRSDGVVIVGGRNVSTAAVAERLSACEGVRECAVFGRADPLLGHRLVAVVVLDPGVELADVRRRIRSSLPVHELPSEIVTTPSLPRNAAGKIQRAALARVAAQPAAGAR